MLVIDRFEGEYAVCINQENNSSRNIPRVFLPPDASEGCCLLEGEGGYRIDYRKTQERRARVAERMSRLYSRE